MVAPVIPSVELSSNPSKFSPFNVYHLLGVHSAVNYDYKSFHAEHFAGHLGQTSQLPFKFWQNLKSYYFRQKITHYFYFCEKTKVGGPAKQG